MKIIVLSGLPGCGKSEYAKRLVAPVPDAVLIELDAECFAEDGSYDEDELTEATMIATRRFVNACRDAVSLIVVDNTNCDPVDIAPYVLVGEAYHYEVEIVRIQQDLDVCKARNTHGVDDAAFENMQEALSKPLPSWWTVTRVWSDAVAGPDAS